ncbi:GTPase Der [Candidatus Erwinia haradaeae]|uniref:GTPase Der n=1 Tax=Candidatus Erwinia haradaeae TaxID=1922217 RepID=A0A451DD57_9GAMM|nr:ribosome biogenesis GTPase Der [Candidatus Erwinia haradaeae]VFP84404.1 GTPase Der [Candidatus Erwinia haradaeae]
MVPVIALIGRPNVGKSTLFNRLTRTQDALVANFPGLTRDRQYGHANMSGCRFICIDTSGIYNNASNLSISMLKQSQMAIADANIIFFIVDARAGLLPEDVIISQQLRVSTKLVFLVVNKITGLDVESSLLEFWSLGLGKPYPIDASHGHGLSNLMELILSPYMNKIQEGQHDLQNHKVTKKECSKTPKDLITYTPKNSSLELIKKEKREYLNAIDVEIKIAIVGQPNVGKSTLTNCLLGEDRVVVCALPGTTRDSIYIAMERDTRRYILIDTAGVRQRRKTKDTIEKFSVIKTLQSIENSHVVMLVIDAQQTISDQDLSLLSFILSSGRSLIVILNKSDILTLSRRKEIKKIVEGRIGFINYIRIHFISALHGHGVKNLFPSIIEAYNCATHRIHTSRLTRILHQATNEHQPPLIRARRIKLKYAHSGGYNPLIIIIHGNQVKNVPDCYKRYLTNYFRRSLKLVGTAIRLQFKEGKNPYINAPSRLSH